MPKKQDQPVCVRMEAVFRGAGKKRGVCVSVERRDILTLKAIDGSARVEVQGCSKSSSPCHCEVDPTEAI